MDESLCWLLPVRNGAATLAQTLQSIRSQTVQPGTVLAWDNGSEDHSVEVLNEWIPRLVPGRVVSDRPFDNLGDCLRHMVEECDSELLVRIDADDVNLPDRLENQLAFLRAHEDCVAVGGQFQRIDEVGQQMASPFQRPLDARDVRFSLLFSNTISHPTVIMKKSAVLEAGNYAAMSFGQDYDLWYRLSSIGPIANVQDTVLKYRVHEHSVSSRSRAEWRSFHRELLKMHCSHVVPGVAQEDCLRVWECVSLLGSSDHCDARTGEILIRMGLAASTPETWRNVDFLATKHFAYCYRRCVRSGCFRMMRRLQLRLHSLGVRTISSVH